MKWAVVTGSSSGLGMAMTVHLLELGFSVAGGSRSGTEIEHENFYDLELDVGDEESVVEFYETLKGLTKKVDASLKQKYESESKLNILNLFLYALVSIIVTVQTLRSASSN